MNRPRLRRAVLAVYVVASAAPLVSFAEEREPVRHPTAASLLSELGMRAAQRLLASNTPQDRLRGLQRLSALGTPRAIDLVARALDPGGAARGAVEHLAAVRALAPHAQLPVARDALVRVVFSPPPEADSGALSEWVQGAAALALAKSQNAVALSALGRALRKPGRAAELTRDALLAHAPRDLAPLLQAPGAPTKELCETLAELGDLRAEAFLRETVRRSTPEARAAAALALLRLGSNEVVELARHWLKAERQPALVGAAVEILARKGTEDAAGALAELARSEVTRPLALSIFLQTDGRVVAPAALDAELAFERGSELLALFARGGAWAVPRLESALRDADTAGLAVYALSLAPGAIALQRLERALTDPRLRAFALRALSLRRAHLGEDSALLAQQLPGSLRSKDPAERAAAAFAQALIDPAALLQGLGSSDPVVVRAVARLALSGAAALAATSRLQRERDPSLRVALGVGLADVEAAASVPTSLLLELVHEAGPTSLLAAAALAARKDAELLPLVRELLTSGDPWLRAHTLLGLSRASAPDALGLVENAYQFEPDPAVRYAAVVALSRRPESVRRRALSLAADLDTSRTVRDAARSALSGQALGDGIAGHGTAWFELTKNPGVPRGTVAAAQIRIGQGFALPLLADPDGVVPLAQVDPAPLAVRLALLEERVNVREASP